jgi:murein DD-endopeptidase MepM/ murein hydrolase activator NlpD
MHPLVKAAIAVAVLSAVGALARPRKVTTSARMPSASASARALVALPCPSRSIPEGDVCVPLPAEDRGRGGKRDMSPARVAHEMIPRRPDRPEDPTRLSLPIPSEVPILFGFDRPGDPEDEASRKNDASVDLGADRGTEVKLAPLVGQSGQAEVLAVGDLFGHTVVTLHRTEEGGHARTYLVFYGRLDAVAPDVAAEKKLDAGDVIGFVGDSGTPGFVHLHLEAREVRDEIDVHPLDMAHLVDQAVSIPVDARNVFVETPPH